jgi:pilus assembly protein Flp/PilA
LDRAASVAGRKAPRRRAIDPAGRSVFRLNFEVIEEVSLMFSIFGRLLKDEAGATAIEYGLIAALISVAAITAFTTVGTKLSTMMTNTANKLN